MPLNPASFNDPKIVVTGLGAITPLGANRADTWSKVKRGAALNRERAPEPGKGEMADFVRSAFFIHDEKLPRVYALGECAMQEALADACLADPRARAHLRLGVCVSVSKPMLNLDPSRSFFSLTQSLPDAMAQYLSRTYVCGGPVQNIIAACATGAYSLWQGYSWLREGLCDVAVCGSVESSLHPLYVAGFHRLGVLTATPRPFDQARSGFILGEGAGVLVLEKAESAQERGVSVYGQLLAPTLGADTSGPVAFDESGKTIAAVVRRALAKEGIKLSDLDYINLHGTGTRLNDLAESRALRLIDPDANRISLSSTKAATGHLLGACGSVEAVLTLCALKDQFVPPTANLETIDPDCGLDFTPRQGRACELRTAGSLSFGFGGAIGVLIFRQ